MCARGRDQAFQRFVQWLVAQTKRPVMHRNQGFGVQLEKGTHCFFRIHVHLAAGRRVVGANRQKRDIYIVMFSDLAKSWEECGVAAVENCSAIDVHRKPTETAVQISEKSRAPMIARRERNLDWSQLHTLPVIQLVNNMETEIVYQITDA